MQPTDAGETVKPRQERLRALLDTGRYKRRFVALYSMLGLILAGSVAGMVSMSTGAWPTRPLAWSSWRPPGTNTAAEIRAIARRVAGDYRYGKAGHDVVSITATSPPVANNGSERTMVTNIFVAPRPGTNEQLTTLDTSGTVMYALCGRGPDCATPGNERRDGMIRREALELALMTLKYAPRVKAVLAIPPPTRAERYALFFEKSTLAPQLRMPLRSTIPASPPLRGDREPARVDSLFESHLFRYRLTKLQLGGLALALLPTSSDRGLAPGGGY